MAVGSTTEPRPPSSHPLAPALRRGHDQDRDLSVFQDGALWCCPAECDGTVAPDLAHDDKGSLPSCRFGQDLIVGGTLA